ncbi:MAG: histidinol-phosphatase HisJ family protein, partial [Anaerovorax sp.]
MYDYHTHTSYSDDCQTPMKDMIASAIQKGALELAITDHYDPDYPDPAFPFIIDFPSYHKDLQEMQENYQKQIKIIKGLEIGIQHGNAMEKCRSQANSFRYDFILGSFHCACGEDLYTGYFDHRSVEKGFEDFYAYMYDCLLLYKDFDILSHFNVIDRYSPYVPD